MNVKDLILKLKEYDIIASELKSKGYPITDDDYHYLPNLIGILENIHRYSKDEQKIIIETIENNLPKIERFWR